MGSSYSELGEKRSDKDGAGLRSIKELRVSGQHGQSTNVTSWPPGAGGAGVRTLYEKISGSKSEKKAEWRRRTASGTSSSLITKVRLISEAPWEIMRTLMSPRAVNTRAAMPEVPRIFSPTRQTMALRPSYLTSAILVRSAARFGIASLESTVSETLTSDVETTSTAQRCRSKASKIAFRNPCAPSMRAATTSTMVIRFFAAMALNAFRQLGAWAMMRVPSHFGLRELSTYTGMFF